MDTSEEAVHRISVDRLTRPCCLRWRHCTVDPQTSCHGQQTRQSNLVWLHLFGPSICRWRTTLVRWDTAHRLRAPSGPCLVQDHLGVVLHGAQELHDQARCVTLLNSSLPLQPPLLTTGHKTLAVLSVCAPIVTCAPFVVYCQHAGL